MSKAIKRLLLPVGAGVVGIGVATALALTHSGPSDIGPASKLVTAQPTLERFEMPSCDGTASTSTQTEGNPLARKSAQRGLNYLSQAATAWQQQHQCYGCHVQAATLEAFSVGRHNQYQVSQAGLDTVIKGMLELNGGARNETGLGYRHAGSIYDAGKIFGVQAFARYDELVSGGLEAELLAEAELVLARQASTGEVPTGYVNAPVAIGTIQSTAQAVVAWRQAYERSADDQWLIGISKAEDYLRGAVSIWKQSPPTDIQMLNYAIMGLVATGMSGDEAAMVQLTQRLRKFQNDDGGWPLSKGATSEPYATGQALYTLRLMGINDDDEGMARGIHWLVERQTKDGSWSDAGFGKAEAMWGVLGLVSMDVLTVTVAGLRDGQHVQGFQALEVNAKDNKGGGVTMVQVSVDDILVHGQCGASLSYDWNTASLSTGKHIVDVRATNVDGKVSRRRLEVFAGDVYMTQLGSRYVEGGTELSLRNITEEQGGSVRVEVFPVQPAGITAASLWSTEQVSKQGPMRFRWDGTGHKGEALPKGKYIARFSFDGASGASQVEDLPFVHDTVNAQLENFAQIQGLLALPEGIAENVPLELVDDKGRVVQRVRSTKSGKYRFRNVDGAKNYKVRVKKKGFRAKDMPVRTKRAEEAEADISLERE